LRHCCILRECEFVQMYGIVRCGVLSWTAGELRVLTAQGRYCIPSRGENPFIKILYNYQYGFISENIRNVKAINDLILSHAAVSTSLAHVTCVAHIGL
jgi:hypothetical protein